MNGSSSIYVALAAPHPNIKYDGVWLNTTINGDPSKATNTPGAEASLTFTGLAVYVFGWAGPLQAAAPVIVCYIDGSMTIQGHLTLPGAAQGLTSWNKIVLCQQEGLTYENHTLQIIVIQASQTYPLILDMFQYQERSGASALGNPNSTGTVSISASSTTLHGSGTTSSIGLAVVSSEGSIAPVVGGVIGAMLAAIMVAVGVFFIIRHGRRRRTYSKVMDNEPHLPINTVSSVSPYTYESKQSKPISLSLSRSLHSPLDTRSSSLSTLGATYQPSATKHTNTAPSDVSRILSDVREDQNPSVRPSYGLPRTAVSERVTAGLLAALQRVRRGRTVEDEPPRHFSYSSLAPSEALPSYSERDPVAPSP
ncbi:hypothetical protein GY45DRAFT_1339585 [Cubamyces sp. BRFM 1775]|nr:hypothetical protein GY45DRAFT_1339585 [Cubamyces sp. BRFM 1775]